MIRCNSLGIKYLLIAMGVLFMVCSGGWLLNNCLVETTMVEIVEAQQSWEEKNHNKGRTSITYYTEYEVLRVDEQGQVIEDTVILSRKSPEQYEAGVNTPVDVHADGTLTDHVYLPQKLLIGVLFLLSIGWTFLSIKAEVKK